MSKVQIIALLLSIIFLGIATGITTLKVPNYENKILDEDSTISKLRYEITKDMVQGLYTMDVQTERRIDLLNIHFKKKMNEAMAISKARSKLEQRLLVQIIHQHSISRSYLSHILYEKAGVRRKMPEHTKSASITGRISQTILLQVSTKITQSPLVRAGFTAARAVRVGHIPKSSLRTGFHPKGHK